MEINEIPWLSYVGGELERVLPDGMHVRILIGAIKVEKDNVTVFLKKVSESVSGEIGTWKGIEKHDDVFSFSIDPAKSNFDPKSFERIRFWLADYSESVRFFLPKKEPSNIFS